MITPPAGFVNILFATLPLQPPSPHPGRARVDRNMFRILEIDGGTPVNDDVSLPVPHVRSGWQIARLSWQSSATAKRRCALAANLPAFVTFQVSGPVSAEVTHPLKQVPKAKQGCGTDQL